jgi:hypothetical protein
MSLNPFASVTDYPSMLDKIGWYNFFIGVILGLFLANNLPDFNAALGSVLTIDVLGVKISLPLALGAVAIAIVSRAIKLHDKISDLFNIRLNFDCEHILSPMFQNVGINVDPSLKKHIRRDRIRLMNRLFYEYASSTEDKCKIDHHNVTMALDQWSWYWILIESLVLLLTSSIICFVFQNSHVGYGLLLLMIIILALAQLMKERACKKYALIEINEILEDPTRKTEVTQEATAFLNAIPTKRGDS